MATPRTIVWFREQDLRLADHAPLVEAATKGQVLPLFVLEPGGLDPMGAQARPHQAQCRLEALAALAAALAARGSRLLLVSGPSERVLPRLLERWRATRIVAHRLTAPVARERDRRLALALGERLELWAGETLMPPGALRTGAGRPYAVFSAFARAFWQQSVIGPRLTAPRTLPPLPALPRADEVPMPTLASLGLRRNPRLLTSGEAPARTRWRRFLRDGLADYALLRDRLDRDGTSRLSLDLALGTLSVRSVWLSLDLARGGGGGVSAFQNELLWREFAYASLWERPDLLARPFRAGFVGFPWRRDEAGWRAWVEGRTGYPVVDAAARQLLAEGFVPNRARMIAASFLAKHLLVDFRRGEAHYLRYLADGDEANNDLGWQWSAGCGADAQPYFRVFNPVLQGERFDPEGDYVRRWLPELGRLPARYVHRPWEAPAGVLGEARLRLGVDYPRPIVSHRQARERFLALAQRHLARSVGG